MSIRIVLPVAAFAGTIYATNRLMSESELGRRPGHRVFALAARASGPDLRRLFIFLVSSILAHLLVPISSARLADRTAEISENMTARLLSEGRFLHPADGVTFYIREITPLGALTNISSSPTPAMPERPVTYTAREALLVRGETAPTLVMIDGMAQAYDSERRRLSVTRFEDFAFDLEGLVDGIAARPAQPRRAADDGSFWKPAMPPKP